MQKHRDVVQNGRGEPVNGASVRVLNLDGSLAAIYASDGGIALANPITTNPLGEYFYYAANGRYTEQVSVGGTLAGNNTDVMLFDSATVTSQTGARKVGYLGLWAGAPSTTVGEMLDILYYGAVSIMRDMTPAQRADVAAFTKSLDVTAACQSVIDFANTTNKAVSIPAGNYYVPGGLKISNSARWIGENQRTATFWGSAAAPAISSKTGFDVNYVTLSDFGVYGGANCIDFTVSSETAFNKLIRLDLYANAGYDCFYISRLLQTTLIDGCVFNGGNRGIACPLFTSNSNSIRNSKFGSHAQAHIYLRNATLNTVFNCTFEGGGVVGQAVFDITGSIGFHVEQCAFENVHNYILRETGSNGTTTFNKNDFIYAVGSAQFLFSSDGDVKFGSNTWYIPSDGAALMTISGDNGGKLGKPGSRLTTHRTLPDADITAPTIAYPVSGQKDLINFACAPPDNALTRLALLSGTLTVNFHSINTGGTVNVIISRQYHVIVASRAGLSLIGSATLMTSADTLSGGAAMTVGVKSGASPYAMTIEANFTSVAPTTGQSIFSWSFKSHCAASDIVMYIAPSIP